MRDLGVDRSSMYPLQTTLRRWSTGGHGWRRRCTLSLRCRIRAPRSVKQDGGDSSRSINRIRLPSVVAARGEKWAYAASVIAKTSVARKPTVTLESSGEQLERGRGMPGNRRLRIEPPPSSVREKKTGPRKREGRGGRGCSERCRGDIVAAIRRSGNRYPPWYLMRIYSIRICMWAKYSICGFIIGQKSSPNG
jgi:hypothetical protein